MRRCVLLCGAMRGEAAMVDHSPPEAEACDGLGQFLIVELPSD